MAARLCSFSRSVVTATIISLFFLFNVQAQGVEQSRVMFILDGSNSMWGQIDGTAKITIAKEVMTDLITGWDESVPVGLMIYGHRRKDDCLDVETITTPDRIDRRPLIEKVQSISPKGKTPISLALTQASSELLLQRLQNPSISNQTKTSLVLVSDGLETCNGDPCATARSLDIANPGTDVHVIGFDLTDEESAALQCIADASGGTFFRANNARDLQDALRKTVEIAGAAPDSPPAPAPEAPGPEPARAEPSMLLYAKFCETCERIEAGKVHWIVESADGEKLFDGLGILFPDDPEFEPGTYKATVRYLSGVLVRDAELVIGEDGRQVGEVNLNGGSAVLFAYATDEKTVPANPIFYQFFPIVDGKASSSALTEAASSNAVTWLPAGRYKVVASHDQIKESAEIEIRAGQETIYEFDMRVGYFQPSAVLTPGGKPLGGNMDYRLFTSETNANDSYASGMGFITGGDGTALRPGPYFVRATLSYNRGYVTLRRIFPFEIRANEVTEPVFDMNAGLLAHAVKSKSGKGISNIDYIRESDGVRVAYFNTGGSNTAAFAVGRYHLRILSGGETYESDPFEITAGKTTTVDVTIP